MMTPRSVDAAVPIYQQVASRLRAKIDDGIWREGHRLPSELVLASQMGVGRSTIREALRVLEESGFITRTSPKIFVVRGHSEDPAVRAVTHALRRRTVTFSALHEALLLLEPELARLAAIRKSEEDLMILRQVLEQQQRHMHDSQRWCQLDEEFHVGIAEAASNTPLLLARVTLGRVLVPTVAQFVTSAAVAQAGMRFHERLVAALEEGDPEIAALVARRHVDDFAIGWGKSGLEYDRDVSNIVDAEIARSTVDLS